MIFVWQAFAEAQWSNGWNIWRIPGIYGWNPIMLRRYQEYIREFTHSADYAQPHPEPASPIASTRPCSIFWG